MVCSWELLHGASPFATGKMSPELYAQAYNQTVYNYSAAVKQAASDPRYKAGLSAARRKAEEIKNTEMVIQAQKSCAHRLQELKPPAEFTKFNNQSIAFFRSQSEQYSRIQMHMKFQHYKSIASDLHDLDTRATESAASVQKTLNSIPQYYRGKQEIASAWSQLKSRVETNAPDIKARLFGNP